MASVLVVDDDQDLRETLGELIDMLGHRSVIAAGLADVVAQRGMALDCELALLDINLGAGMPSGLDVYRWLQSERFAGTIRFLTGHARSHPMVSAACESGAQVLDKPIGVDALRAMMPHAA